MKTLRTLIIALAISCVAGCSDTPVENFTFSKILGTWTIDEEEYFTFTRDGFIHGDGTSIESGVFAFSPEADVMVGKYDNGNNITIEMEFQDEDHAMFTIDNSRTVMAERTQI